MLIAGFTPGLLPAIVLDLPVVVAVVPDFAPLAVVALGSVPTFEPAVVLFVVAVPGLVVPPTETWEVVLDNRDVPVLPVGL